MFNIESRRKSIIELGVHFDFMDGFQSLRPSNTMYVITVAFNLFLLVKIKTAFEAVILYGDHSHGKVGIGSFVLIVKKSFIIIGFFYFFRNIFSVLRNRIGIWVRSHFKCFKFLPSAFE